MDSSLKKSWILLFLLHLVFLQIHFPYSVNSQPYDYPTANLSTSWINGPSALYSTYLSDNSTARAILVRGTNGPGYACGFFCDGDCQTYLFAIFIVQTDDYTASGSPPVVWSANRNHPVRFNATLELKSDGDLILKDVDGTLAWSANTTGKSIAGLNLTETGNLVLFDVNKRPVWQSFDHPTDSLVPGQTLFPGQKLSASVSETNWSNGDLYSLSVTSEGLFAFVGSNPPQPYYKYFDFLENSSELSYVKYLSGSLKFYNANSEPKTPVGMINFTTASSASAQYMKLGHDGHLRVHEWNQSQGWTEVADHLEKYLSKCRYPMVCGKYGICSNGQCSCPAPTNRTSYFLETDRNQPDLGCSETVPLSCESSQYHGFLDLADVTYFTFNSDIENTDMEACKQACLKNCSCKAAFYKWNGSSMSGGRCYLPSEIFSLMNNDKTRHNSSAFLKVQNIPVPVSAVSRRRKTNRVSIIIAGSSLGAFFTLFLIIGTLVFVFRKNRDADEDDDDYIDQVPGMPARFSYEELKAATENFSRKLGQGGFGSVFEGVLADGIKIAVKRLDGLGHIKKSFLAEVESIGSIHHVNLARLVGFCAEKTYRLLVYEFMSNGSLDTWIFHKNNEVVLGWNQRKKIILDIAKGLSYLHEDCRQKIVHLDIKPQNILLDENFNAKVSDFGLSKLIDRDQSQVMTTMRGTPGYLAPEWLSSVITEKVDVYSYGVVVLEILCGRKNLDRSQPEEHMHLLSLFKKKAEDDQLLDMVDKYSEDMQLHGAEIVETMRVAAWCLQSDFAKRPSMSVVVKVLEGVMDVELDIDYNFLHQTISNTRAEGHNGVHYGAATPLLPSVLSGPR